MNIHDTWWTHENVSKIADNEAIENGFTDDVLIDIDGTRTKFVVGHYDTDEKKWVSHSLSVNINKRHMKWTFLPLIKYDELNRLTDEA